MGILEIRTDQETPRKFNGFCFVAIFSSYIPFRELLPSYFCSALLLLWSMNNWEISYFSLICHEDNQPLIRWLALAKLHQCKSLVRGICSADVAVMLTLSEWKPSSRKMRVDLDHKLIFLVVGMSILIAWLVLNQQKPVGAITKSWNAGI